MHSQFASEKAKAKARMGLVFVLPGLIFIFIYMIYPLAASLWYSFSDYNFVYDLKPTFVGLKNYISSFSDQNFLISMKNTLTFAFFYFLITMILALVLALLIFYYKGSGSFLRLRSLCRLLYPFLLHQFYSVGFMPKILAY